MLLSLEEVRKPSFSKAKDRILDVSLKQLIAIAEAEVFVDDTCRREICFTEDSSLAAAAATFLTSSFWQYGPFNAHRHLLRFLQCFFNILQPTPG